MQLNSFSFNHLWLESLNTETVQCRSTVQKNRVTFHHIFKYIPYNRFLAVNNFFSALNGLDNTTFNKFTNYERFIEFGSHKFRKTALTHFKFRTDNNNRTGRIIDTLS